MVLHHLFTFSNGSLHNNDEIANQNLSIWINNDFHTLLHLVQKLLQFIDCHSFLLYISSVLSGECQNLVFLLMNHCQNVLVLPQSSISTVGIWISQFSNFLSQSPPDVLDVGYPLFNCRIIGLTYWPWQHLQSFHGVVKCIVLSQDKVWQRLCAVSSTCFDGTNTHFRRETGYVANTRFFWSCLDSDLTSRMPALPALWQHRLPCGRVVVEHEMCGYCGPISLKILWSPPPETEGAIRKVKWSR